MSTLARRRDAQTTIDLAAPRRERIVALDAHRGLALVILLLVNTAGIHSALPYQLTHPDWHGLTFADTFFPVFLFAMGAAMAFSTRAQRTALVVRRVVMLFAIGVGLQWLRQGEPKLTGILQKIAVAYLLAWLVLRLPQRAHLPLAIAIVAGMWAAFTWASPGGVVAGSWEPRTNLAGWLDTVVVGHPATEGFATAIMAAANVIGGAVVVRGLRDIPPREALRRIVLWTVAAVAVGLLLSLAVPINKRIWTPSFTVLVHGIACAYLALFWWLTEIRRWRRPVRPLVALGRNPIFIYVLFTVAHELLRPVREPVMDVVSGAIGALPASLVWSAALLGVAWALGGFMDRRSIYVRV